MADVNTAPRLTRNRKLGKNKKKSWRASKIEDVEEFLEDERKQIRMGGLVSEKSDQNLFVLDTGAKPTSDVDGPKSKKKRLDKSLRCYAILEPDPHSQTVRIPDQPSFQKGLRSQRVLGRLQARSLSQVRLAAQSQRQQRVQTRKVQLEEKKQLPFLVEASLWSDEVERDTEHLKSSVRRRKKPSALNATVVPHPGASVNPSYEDHQDLLYQALRKEEEHLKKERKIYNALEAKFPTKSDAPNESTYLEEMAAGLVDDSSDEDDDETDDDAPLSVNPPVRREDRKTRKQRRIRKEEAAAAVKRAKEAELKKRENMVLRLPSLKSDINKAERKKKERTQAKEKLKELEPYKTKKLGKIKFEEADLDLKLSTELVASLRQVKPEGHILNDVYKSLQRRNIIEPRVRQKLKKTYRPKKFEKKGHKLITL